MVNDLAAGTQASIALMNEEGLEDAIVPLTGDFRDKKDVLSFNSGQFQVLMASDRCNAAFKDGLEDNDKATEVEKGGAEEEGNSDLFKRNLRNPVSFTSTKSTSNSRVLTRHRDEYTTARLAIQEGRHLSEMSFVEIEMEEEISRDGTKALLQSVR